MSSAKNLNGENIKFYGMLYLDEEHIANPNLKAGKVNPQEYYVKCAVTLANSLERHGENFTLITNNAQKIHDLLRQCGLPALTVQEIAFSNRIPKGTRFFQSHQRLDVLRAFGTGQFGQRAGWLDLDTVLLKPLSSTLTEDGVHVYDITEQFPIALRDAQTSDLQTVMQGSGPKQPVGAAPRRYGGEFMIASATDYAKISDTVDTLLDHYLANIDQLSDDGDEMIVSAALNLLGQAGLELIDHGRAGTIARWWSARTGWIQPPFSEISNRVILHLPSDKPFLASIAAEQNPAILPLYQNYVRPKLRTRRLANPFLNALRKETKYAARI